jgi:acyl-CoA synthetase (AMP-forming)/AMP-acid ligase II
MLASSRFPKFTFVDAGGLETVLDLRQATGRIRAVAARIREIASPGATMGLMYPSGAELVVNWLACLLAGTCPLVMQYPTRKQSREYWATSVSNTIREAQLAAVLADERCVQLGMRQLVTTIAQRELDVQHAGSSEPFLLEDFSIIQLSSGTTGHRKAVRFHSAQLERHVLDFNRTLGLDERDTIVSWLPLYHDMGYIACFVMPLLVGSRVVMMDPMSWVSDPALLDKAIARHAGSICYMPNFGFEVMSRLPLSKPSTVRWWIACSEPVSASTARKFLEVSGAAPESFAPCYAMAENVFAVSLRRGIKTRRINGVEVVSCGKPIEGVQVKVVDDQIWVRSPASLRAYMNGSDIRDADGFYPTGDLGELHEDELYVTGRKQDMMIQAGVKYMLSDIDLALNEMFPDIKGRAASVALRQDRLGTESLLVLVESVDFWLRRDQGEIGDALKGRFGIDQIKVEFVPPRFLTKTSSGKINRKRSAEDWRRRELAAAEGEAAHDPVEELRGAFRGVSWSEPVRTILDSLSLTILRTILAETHVRYDARLTLAQLEEGLLKGRPAAPSAKNDVIRIISLADKTTLQRIKPEHLERLGRLVGAEVTLEHACLPPSAILLSDLIFLDYFGPRLGKENTAALAAAARKLREASLILVDDVAEMYFPLNQVYGVLSHNLERDSRADLIAVRWQRYARMHHKLPLTVVSGVDLSPENCSSTLRGLQEYLGRPTFRVATIKGFEAFTSDWDYRPLHGVTGRLEGLGMLDPDEWVQQISSWILSRPEPLRTWPRTGGERMEMSDLAHFCSHMSRKEIVDRLLQKYERFCIVGQPASVPYIRKELERLGKPFVQTSSYSPAILEQFKGQFDCLLICGSQGNYPIDFPAAGIMRASGSWTTQHIGDPELANKVFSTSKAEAPASGRDWYYPYDFDSTRNAHVYRTVWVEATRKVIAENQGRRRELLRELAAIRRSRLESGGDAPVREAAAPPAALPNEKSPRIERAPHTSEKHPEQSPLQVAAKLHADGRLYEALEAYKQIYRQRPNATVGLRIVRIHQDARDEAAAKLALDAALKDFPDDFMLNHVLAMRSYRRGDFETYHQAVRKMAAAAPDGRADPANEVFWPFVPSSGQFKGQYLFVSGASRSGTTALGDLLNLSPDVLLLIERYSGFYGYSKSLFDRDRVFAMNGHPHEQRNSELLKRYPQVRFIGDKRSNFALTLRSTMDRFSAEDVRIVHIVREPEEVGPSFERRAANERHKWPSDRGFAAAIDDINWNNHEILRVLERDDWARSIRVVDYASFWDDLASVRDLYRWLGLSVPAEAESALRNIYKKAQTVAARERHLSTEHERIVSERHDRAAHERILAYAASARRAARMTHHPV